MNICRVIGIHNKAKHDESRQSWSKLCIIEYMLCSRRMYVKYQHLSSQKVSKRFCGTWSEGRDYGFQRNMEARFGIESMNGMKITRRITGLSENLGRDNGTESRYWVPQIW